MYVFVVVDMYVVNIMTSGQLFIQLLVVLELLLMNRESICPIIVFLLLGDCTLTYAVCVSPFCVGVHYSIRRSSVAQ